MGDRYSFSYSFNKTFLLTPGWTAACEVVHSGPCFVKSTFHPDGMQKEKRHRVHSRPGSVL